MIPQYIEYNALDLLARNNPELSGVELLEIAKSEFQYLACPVGFEDIDDAIGTESDLPLTDERKIEILIQYQRHFDWTSIHDDIRSAASDVFDRYNSTNNPDANDI